MAMTMPADDISRTDLAMRTWGITCARVVLGLPRGTVKSRTARGLRRLERALEAGRDG